MNHKLSRPFYTGLGLAALLLPSTLQASSHMDAPLITLDPAANTTDVYAFVAAGDNGDTNQFLVVGLGVYPFEEPGIGPNAYNFDPNVLYQIHICTSYDREPKNPRYLDDLAAGRASVSYQFQFKTAYKSTATILQAYLGVITNIGDANQNLTQTYTVTKVDHRTGRTTVLGTGVVPPNNEGDATPFYNQGNDGDNPAKQGVADMNALDPYTLQAITTLKSNYTSFAGQRDDGFYADVLALFDLAQVRNPGKDSQKGFNIHEMVLRIPLSELASKGELPNMQTVGVYATTSRRYVTALRNPAAFAVKTLTNPLKNPFVPGENKANIYGGEWVQVARQGNPLFNEVLVALAEKDVYSRTLPTQDSALFAQYALNPELAGLLNALVFKTNTAPTTDRTDLEGIFIPDVIKVDLSTGPARLQGGGENDGGYSSMSFLGGDTLTSLLTTNGVPGGWPNGRRYGDDVVSIALSAVASDLRPTPPILVPVSDNVPNNDMLYNKVFPYESTPQNGRNHSHD